MYRSKNVFITCPFYFVCTITSNPLEFFLEKFNHLGMTQQRYRRQVDVCATT